MKKRTLLLGSNALLVTLLSFGILIFLYQLNKEYRMQWDLSAEARHSLSLDMKEALDLIDQEVEPIIITAFTSQEGRRDSMEKNRYVQDLLQQIGRNSKNIIWEQVDFDKERLTAERLGVSDYGRIVVQQGKERVDIKERTLFKAVKVDQRMRLDFYGEEELLRAFSTIIHNEIRKVLFTKGSGELSPRDTSSLGLSSFQRALELRSFSVGMLDLLAVSSIPSDTNVLVVAQPTEGLSRTEQNTILDYISRGGAVILAYKSSDSLPLLERLQIRMKTGVALDLNAQFPYWDRPIVQLGTASVAQEIQDLGLSVVFVGSQAVEMLGSSSTGIQQDSIARLSRMGWLERGGEKRDGRPVFDDGIDERGSFSLASALEIYPNSKLLEAKVSSARVIVMGDMEWLSNGVLEEVTGNLALGMSIAEWAVGSKNSQSTRKHTIGSTELIIAKPQLDGIRLIALFPMPLLVFGIGFMVWWNRRGR